jgi:hypothetical protein
MMVEVFFDYTCGFSNRARRWLDALEDVPVRWRPFSLLEQNRRDAGPPVFDRPEHADNVSLVALAVHEAVRADVGDLDAYRRAMFTAWHDQPGRLSTSDIVEFGRSAGLRRFDHDRAFAALAAEHAAAQALGVFGTPTLVFDDGQAVYVKLDNVPDDEARGVSLWSQVRALAEGAPELREWHRATPDA